MEGNWICPPKIIAIQNIIYNVSVSPKYLNAWLHTYFQHGEYPDYHRHEYKLIQIKNLNNKVTIMGIGEGAALLMEHHMHKILGGSQKRKLSYNHQTLPRKSEMISESSHIGIYERPMIYHIPNYIPLGQRKHVDEYERIKATDGYEVSDNGWLWYAADMLALIERLLLSHISGAYERLTGQELPERAQLTLFAPLRSRTTRFRNTKVPIGKANDATKAYLGYKLFDIHFATNIYLPQSIGLGSGVDLGYGTIYRYDNI